MTIKNFLKKIILNYFLEPQDDSKYLKEDVPLSTTIAHDKWQDFLIKLANEKHLDVLEIGSREVCGPSKIRKRLTEASYTGFDYYPGSNVDVVGDVHKLSSYFRGKKFDLIFSSACFEHFVMPWIASQEMVKLLKTGGYIFVETHYCYQSHERPWHFFQFSENALEVLFNEQMGIKCLEKGCSNPLVARFSDYAAKYLQRMEVPGMYCHSEFFGQKIKDVPNFNWYNVDLNRIYNNTEYVKPKIT